ncbi:MAG: hypothetical protein ACI4EW_06865 [Butyrivibrio sp.]
MQINCFGDSLTAGTAFGNSLSYPAVLHRLTGLTVNNYGIGGENSMTIAVRVGALPLNAVFCAGRTAEFMDAGGKEGFPVTLRTDNDMTPGLLKQVKEDTGEDLVNPVTIPGHKGRLIRREEKYYFIPDEPMEEIPEEVSVKTYLSGMDFSDDINIFWAGTNDYASMSNVDEVTDNIDRMIRFTASDRYLVIGLTAKEYMPELTAVNEVLRHKYNSRFLDFHEYLVENAATLDCIGLSSDDIETLKLGEMPDGLMKAPCYDHVHGNEKFFELLGNRVYGKLLDLNYLRV